MKKICLTVVGLYLILLHAFSQSASKDSSGFKPKPLKLDEVNLVSGYYSQNGDHSPITGGIGTEQLTDLSNGLELKLVSWDIHQRKNSVTAGFGIDHRTAASQAYVSKSGASSTKGTRVYPSLNWLIENEKKGTGFGLGAYYSAEYNYHSIGLNAEFSKKTNRNGEFSAKLITYFDQVKLIYPSELIPLDTVRNTGDSTVFVTTASGRMVLLSSGTIVGGDKSPGTPSSPRDSYTASFTFAQVINERMQASVLLDLVYQNGYLGLPFHRVYFADGSVHVESLPSQRFKLPIGFRLNYFLGDNIVFRSFYRFYVDDWGLWSHTAQLEIPIKINPFFSVYPFYRYYIQNAVRYFAPYETHTAQDSYYTSNYELSAFTSQYFGMGFRLAPPSGILHTALKALEVRYGHYTQTTGLAADAVSLELQFK
jgi:hypothetical protein